MPAFETILAYPRFASCTVCCVRTCGLNVRPFGMGAGDWKKRSEDYHFKEKRLKALYEKARNRNPDEFYHSMVKAQTRAGVHIAAREGKEYTTDELKLLKTQDLNYLRAQLTTERKVSYTASYAYRAVHHH